MRKPIQERRTSVRYRTRISTRARLLRAVEQGSWPGRILNFSRRGIRLLCPRPFKAGTRLTLHMPAKVGVADRVVCVRYAKPLKHPGFFIVGGDFLQPLSDAELAQLTIKAIAGNRKADRRHEERFHPQVRFLCRLVRAEEVGSWPTLIRNVSRHGMGLITDRLFIPGTILTLEISVQNTVRRKHLRISHAEALVHQNWWMVGGRIVQNLSDTELMALLANS